MKILELTNFSSGICGVFTRVKHEALLLTKNHEVRIFSSNFVKGKNEIASPDDKIGQVIIKRFPAKHLGGEGFLNWDFKKEALEFKPDIIIAHSYRQLHSTKALKIAKQLNCKVFLVTHAPFARANRPFHQKIIVWLYDILIGKRTIKKFNKIIAITKWELTYLLKLGLKKEKISYIPNGIPSEFFSQKKTKEENKILFLGRVAPIKNLEVVIEAIPFLKKELFFEIVGPAEKSYLIKLKDLINQKKLEKKVIFSAPIYNFKEKIKKLDSAKIFVLPSITEGMPQSLIEAMARSKIVIARKNLASQDLIQNGENGFLFNSDNEIAEIINKINTLNKIQKNKIKKQAKKSVEQFAWSIIIKKLEKSIKSSF